MKTVADPRVINLSSEIITETRAGETEVSSWSPLLSHNLDIDIDAYYIDITASFFKASTRCFHTFDFVMTLC